MIIFKFIGYGILVLAIGLGLFQWHLFPGVVWNVSFPIILIASLLFFALNKGKISGKYLQLCFGLLCLIIIAEIGFKLYSNTHISTPKDGKELSVMTYNIFFKNKEPGQAIAVIKASNPDVLFVQELTPSWSNQLDKNLSNYPYKVTKPMKGTHGIGIYSKYKIAHVKYMNNTAGKPYAQVAELNFENKYIQLINTHLASPAIAVENQDNFLPLYYKNYKTRATQLKAISTLANDNSTKYTSQLMVGDLNTTQLEPIFKNLKLTWVNAHSKSGKGCGFNFPHSGRIIPFLTLDYVMARGNIKFVKTEVIQGGSSDHLPILSLVQL